MSAVFWHFTLRWAFTSSFRVCNVEIYNWISNEKKNISLNVSIIVWTLNIISGFSIIFLKKTNKLSSSIYLEIYISHALNVCFVFTFEQRIRIAFRFEVCRGPRACGNNRVWCNAQKYTKLHWKVFCCCCCASFDVIYGMHFGTGGTFFFLCSLLMETNRHLWIDSHVSVEVFPFVWCFFLLPWANIYWISKSEILANENNNKNNPVYYYYEPFN